MLQIVMSIVLSMPQQHQWPNNVNDDKTQGWGIYNNQMYEWQRQYLEMLNDNDNNKSWGGGICFQLIWER